MNKFYYSIPTEVYFGKGQIKHLAEISNLGSKVLMVYGGGSIKRNGAYDDACTVLHEAGVKYYELSGVDPNPRIETVRLGADLCRSKDIDVILAIGGGSAIDCSKVIAAAACYDGDPWDLVLDGSKITAALPVVTVLTMAATGSEMNGNAVISDMRKNDKFGTYSQWLKPVFSVLDPKYTYSLPKNQTAAGVADIMSHVFEQYFTNVESGFLQARLCEAVLKTCIEFGPTAISEPEDFDARANIMWASSLGLNGLLSYGTDVAWTVHGMEHELSAFYDITHGAGLAILTPFWMDKVLSEKTAPQFAAYGRNVWGLGDELSDMEAAEKAIQCTREFFKKMDLPATLADVDIDDKYLPKMAEKLKDKFSNTFVPLNKEEVLEIYRAAL